MTSKAMAVTEEKIASRIHYFRGEKVLLDADLAQLYGVETGQLNRAVNRNLDRFPKDFMFRLTRAEYDAIPRSPGMSKRGGVRYLPYAFTEQGVAMLSSVLKSKRAIEVNIAIMRTFVQMRTWLSAHKDLASKLESLEKKYDNHFQVVFDAIRQLMRVEERPRRTIGFQPSRGKENNSKV